MTVLKPLIPALLFLLALPVQARSPEDMPPDGPRDRPAAGQQFDRDRLPPPLKGLNLSAEQKDQVRALLRSHHETRRERQSDPRQAHQTLARLSMEERFDEARARELADTLGRTLADQELQRARMHAEIYRLLTPQQQATLKQRLDQPPPRGGVDRGDERKDGPRR